MPSRLSSKLIPLLTAFLLTGCFAPRLNAWQKSQLEGRTSDDIGAHVEEFGSFSSGLEAIDTARGLWEDCYTGWGGCQRCYSLDGDSAAGTVTMELTTDQSTPACTQALTLDDVRYEYTIDERSWAGSWALASGAVGVDALWDVSWTGNHAATLTVTGSERYDGTYDSSFVMNAASGVTDADGELSEWAVDYDYTGYLDRDWHVTASMDTAEVITGSVVGSDGTTCAVSGTRYDVVVDCD